MKHWTVGLTGGIGSGKSSVAQLFESLGASVIDSDALAHELTAAGGAAIPAIRRSFGEDLITAEGALDRARMRALAFSHPASKQQLEAILHPMIGVRAEALMAQASGPYVIRMIPLLIEAGDPRGRFDRVLVVDCPEALQIERTMARSALSRAEVEAIMAQQASRAQRRAYADDVIDNSGPPEALKPQVETLHRLYLQYAAAH